MAPAEIDQASPPQRPRILLVKLSAVGDVVHALPVLNALRETLPEAYLGWVTHPGPANLLEGHPQLDELIILPRRRAQWKEAGGILNVIRRLKTSQAGGWDYAIDLQGLTKSGLAAWLSGAPERIGFAGPASRELNSRFMTLRLQPQTTQVIRMNLELLAGLGLEGPFPPEPVLHMLPDDVKAVSTWAADAGVKGERFLIVDAFAGWPTKTWSHDRWVDVINRVEQEFGVRSLLFFGPGEQEHAEALASKASQAEAHPLVAPKTTLRQYTALLRAHAVAFVGGDTGPMHMAAAAKVPVVALFGPSDPRRNAPVFKGARFEILQDTAQPCANTFDRTCKHHPEPGGCLRTLSVDQVMGALGKLLAKRGD